MILTEDDVKLEIQIERCKVAIDEYFRGQQISIDYVALFKKLEPYPLLFQFAHLIAFKGHDWKDALRWCHDHKAEILAHEENVKAGKIIVNESGPTGG
jgi:hypothetical protein